MKVALINPNIVSQKVDLSGSGIPYMPIGLAYLASYLRSQGHEVQVIDAFGEAPERVQNRGSYYIQGLTPKEVIERILSNTDIIGFYAHLTVTHSMLLEIIKLAKKYFPSLPFIVLENINKVNAYSLRHVYEDFFKADVDYVVLGYLERRTQRLIEAINTGVSDITIDGIIVRNNSSKVIPPEDFNKDENLDDLPFPAWDLFPLQNYWRLGYAHGPLTSDKYLPLLTSRGCPYNCGFCILPEVSNRRWKARSAENIIKEIVFFQQKYGIEEFHIEDPNPTINKERIKKFCNLLIERDIHIKWKLAQGTKVESLDEEIIDLMAKAGCNYISVSPESGSQRVLRLMDKPVNHAHTMNMVKLMKQKGIYTQACFVLGYPGESHDDLNYTARLVRKLARIGIDEIALFIITPMPGSRIFHQRHRNFISLEQLTFTPKWRSDYKKLAVFRKMLYCQYIAIKFLFHPFRLMGYGWALLTGNFQTKVEMTLYRKLKVAFLAWKNIFRTEKIWKGIGRHG